MEGPPPSGWEVWCLKATESEGWLSEYLRKTQEKGFVYSRSPLSPTRPRIFISRAGKVNRETNPGQIRELCHSIASWMVSLERVAVRNAARAWQSARTVGAQKLKARGTSNNYTPAPSPYKWEKTGLEQLMICQATWQEGHRARARIHASPSLAPELGQYRTKSNAWASKAVLLTRIGNRHWEL